MEGETGIKGLGEGKAWGRAREEAEASTVSEVSRLLGGQHKGLRALDTAVQENKVFISSPSTL